MNDLLTVVVDDDYRVANLHAEVVRRTNGFSLTAVCSTVAETRAALRRQPPDLLLLDLYLPDGSGLDLLREWDGDAYVLSAAAEPELVRAAFSRGALMLLRKPFEVATLADRLAAYRRYRRILTSADVLSQGEIDQAMRTLHSGGGGHRPKGHSTITEQAIVRAVAAAPSPLSAIEVGQQVGISRATAQRYLAALNDAGQVDVRLRYGATGRPEHRYVASK